MFVYSRSYFSVYIANLKKRKVDFNFGLLNYSIYLISINFIIVCILTFIFKNPNSILEINSFNNLFAVKYLLVSISLSMSLPFLFEVIGRNIFIDLEWVEEDELPHENKDYYVLIITSLLCFTLFF